MQVVPKAVFVNFNFSRLYDQYGGKYQVKMICSVMKVDTIYNYILKIIKIF